MASNGANGHGVPDLKPMPPISRLATIPNELLERLYRYVAEKNAARCYSGGETRGVGLVDGELISEGRRNDKLTSLGGTMRKYGFSKAAIMAALLEENDSRCDPPLDVAEVETIAGSVSRYKPDPLAGMKVVHGGKAKEEGGAKESAPAFPEPIPASRLQIIVSDRKWLWEGFLARSSITLLSALWKAGKTTLLTHLLQALESDGFFCGQPAKTSKVLYVTEEHESLWAERRDKCGIADHVEFLIRPFPLKPRFEDWITFTDYAAGLVSTRGYDLIIFDTISDLWSVKDENNAAEVQAALMPIRSMTANSCVLLVHHARKADGLQATAARGSGALCSFPDTLLEFRRYTPGDESDCRRVISGFSRYQETPRELVVELTDTGYVPHGDKNECSKKDLTGELSNRLPVGTEQDAVTFDQVYDGWERPKPNRNRLLDAINHGCPRYWRRIGEGKRGDPHRFWVPKG